MRMWSKNFQSHSRMITGLLRYLINLALFLLLVTALSVVATNFVGDVTIYTAAANERREAVHEIIIQNRKPEGGWNSIGLAAPNLRVLIPYLAETIKNLTSVPVTRIYKGIDL